MVTQSAPSNGFHSNGNVTGDAAVVRVDAPRGAAGDLVRATAFTRPGRGMIVVVASWAAEQRQVSLAVDWLRLGVGKQQAALDVPSIPSLQTEGSAPRPVVDAHGKITLTVRPGAGLLFVLSNKDRGERN